MLQGLREIEGGISLSLNVAARLPRLRKAPIFESFLRQVYFTGVTAATGVVMRATMLGVLIIAVMMDMLDADVDLAVKILLLLVFREIGPLAAAVVVILRTGTAVSAEMAVMRVTGQTRTLNYLGIDLYDYLVLPRVVGIMHAGRLLLFDHEEPALRLRRGGDVLLAGVEPAGPYPERGAQGGDPRSDAKRDARPPHQRGVRLPGFRHPLLRTGKGEPVSAHP
jgi:hypothetical protein